MKQEIESLDLGMASTSEKDKLIVAIHKLIRDGNYSVLDQGKILIFGGQKISNVVITTDLQSVTLIVQKSEPPGTITYTGTVSKLSKPFQRILAQIYKYTKTHPRKEKKSVAPTVSIASNVPNLPYQNQAMKRFRANSNANARFTRSSISDDITWGKALSHTGDLK